ncbi:MAG: VanZ family protein [Microgenomates group bacterium]
MKKIFFLWLPVGIWMGTLFYFSSIPNLRAVENNFWDEIIRSGAHFVFYALGYFLFFRAINFGKTKKNFWLPLILTGTYGFFDEIHQTFVPTRTFQIKDLLVDFGGGFLGYLVSKK